MQKDTAHGFSSLEAPSFGHLETFLDCGIRQGKPHEQIQTMKHHETKKEACQEDGCEAAPAFASVQGF